MSYIINPDMNIYSNYVQADGIIDPSVETYMNYPLRFRVTNENTMWFLGGLAAAFLFSKFIKIGMFSKVGYYGGLAAAGLAVTDFIGVLSIDTVKSIVPGL